MVNNRIRITKYNLLVLINQTYNLNKDINLVTTTKAVNKVLVDTRCDVDWDIKDYPTQLEELRNFNPLAHVRPATT